MVDRRPTGYEQFLNAEYWDGHAPSDDCGPYNAGNRKKPSYRSRLQASRFAREILGDFYSTPNREPLRVFSSGDTFIIDEFPQGTIVEVNFEQITREKKGRPKNYEGNLLGIVYEFQRDGATESMLLSYDSSQMQANAWTNISLFQNAGFYTFRDPIDVGTVTHYKVTHGDQIARVNRIKLYEIGKLAPQEVKRRAPIVRAGLVFRQPIRA